MSALPVVVMTIDGVDRHALVDTGCTDVLIYRGCVTECDGSRAAVLRAVSGSELKCVGVARLSVEF